LIDFVAFLAQKLWQNNQILIGEIHQESRYASKPTEDSRHPRPCILGQKGENMPPLRSHPQRTPNSKIIFYFNLHQKTYWFCRGFEQHCSSIGWWVMACKA